MINSVHGGQIHGLTDSGLIRAQKVKSLLFYLLTLSTATYPDKYNMKLLEVIIPMTPG